MNSAHFQSLKFCQIYLFSVAYNTPKFELRFCRIVDLKVIYIQNFYFKILETCKYRFQFFSKIELTGAWEPFVVFASTACYLISRSPFIPLDKKTPIEVWSISRDDYSQLRVLGCTTYAPGYNPHCKLPTPSVFVDMVFHWKDIEVSFHLVKAASAIFWKRSSYSQF
jgi:hypothetical protein